MPAPANVVDFPGTAARVDRIERARTNNRWGDITAPQLSNVLDRGAQGDIADLADLCEYAIGSDDHLSSLYDTRISRVMQADWIIVPGKFGDPAIAVQAAKLVDELILRIDNWHQAARDLLHAIAVGHSCGENAWAHDELSHTYYVKSITHRHGHRFRYDEEYQIRLYDRGTRRGDGSAWGEALDPRMWTIHQHRVQAGYASIGGVMRSCLWRWLFRRWVDKWWLGYVEKHGSPIAYAKVAQGTPTATRNRILAQLEELSAEHSGVIEEGGELVVLPTAAAASSWESYQAYMGYTDGSLTKAWLGATDLVDPGKVGSQAAVGVRAGITVDPRMVTDGSNFAASMRATLFKQLIVANAHKFTVRPDQIPIPEMRMRTADDEVKRDHSDFQAETDASGVSPAAILKPDQVAAVEHTVEKVNAGKLTREQAMGILCACYGVAETTAERVLGLQTSA